MLEVLQNYGFIRNCFLNFFQFILIFDLFKITNYRINKLKHFDNLNLRSSSIFSIH
jgi:hypothetical protein